MFIHTIRNHIRSKDWFAVLIDFLIVVLGVFIGLQVQDWNEARKDRIAEQVLIKRLVEETTSLIDAHERALASFRLRAQVLEGINPVLFSQQPLRVLADEECHGILRSHVYRRPADELPILDEMLETGRFDLLQNDALKLELRAYLRIRERSRGYYQEAINELFRLHSRFPELIVIRRVPINEKSDAVWRGLSGDGYHWVPECNVAEMRSSNLFLNEYVDNLSRINTLTSFTEERHDQLNRILAALGVR